jgi:KDO2-lipid IV(A) lauroyltransferase
MSRSPTLAHRAEYALVAGVAMAVALMTDRAAARFATGLGHFTYRVLRIRRKIVEANLRSAFPNRDDRWVRATAAASYAHLIREAVATLRASRRGPEWVRTHVVCEGIDAVREALAAGHGVILLGGHLGNWELGAATPPAFGLPVLAMVRRQKNPLFDRALTAARNRLGIAVVDRHHATGETLRALRENRVSVIIADQDARRAGVFVPFFGRPASTARGPAVLALRARATLLVMTTFRRPDGLLHVRFEALNAEAAPGESPVEALTAAFIRRLEAGVRAAPEQYLWHHRRWKTRPAQ